MCALITRAYGPSTSNPVAPGSTVLNTHINTDVDTVYNEINGNLDNDNIKAGAAIAISKTALGTYTVWTSYAPSYYAETGTWGSITTWVARYCQMGKTVFVQVHATGTTGAGATALGFSVPIVPLQVGAVPDIANGALTINAGGTTYRVGIVNYDTTQSKMLVRGDNALVWTNAAGNGFSCQIFYEVA
jgi:hypothetical protein